MIEARRPSFLLLTTMKLLAASAALLLSGCPALAQELPHQRRVLHRPDRPVRFFTPMTQHLIYFLLSTCYVSTFGRILFSTTLLPLLPSFSRRHSEHQGASDPEVRAPGRTIGELDKTATSQCGRSRLRTQIAERRGKKINRAHPLIVHITDVTSLRSLDNGPNRNLINTSGNSRDCIANSTCPSTKTRRCV